jgi:hypothetical protein
VSCCRGFSVRKKYPEKANLGGILVLSNGSGGGLETGLLLRLCLGTVFVEQLEELGGGVLVEGVGELGDGRGDLEALVQDHLLALETDVFGPLDEARQVLLGLDVLACISLAFHSFSLSIASYQCQSSWGWTRREGSSWSFGACWRQRGRRRASCRFRSWLWAGH